MTAILAIDPGTTRSAWVLFDLDEQRLLDFAIEDNADLAAILRINPDETPVVIEKIVSYGMPIGAETLETVFWSGRFAEAAGPAAVHRIPRKAIVTHLCGSARAKDSNVRQALLDRFGPQGTKKAPGVLYGVHKDVWAALALAVTWADTEDSL